MRAHVHTLVAEAVKLWVCVANWVIDFQTLTSCRLSRLRSWTATKISQFETNYTISLIVLGISLSCGGLESAENPKDSSAVTITDLRCERLATPLAIDFEHPRLSWKLLSDTRNVHQTAYRICVASDPELLQNEGETLKPDLWDSGRIESDQSIGVPYDGENLRSLDRCYWNVKVWTNLGESDWSSVSQWTMGLLYQNEWQGRWIGFDRAFEWDDVSKFSRLSARYFRKEFVLKPDREIVRATVFLMGLGLYELHLNGTKVGSQVLSPSPTDFGKQVKYNATM